MGPPWSHFPSDLGGGGRTFCALYSTFCTWMSQTYILCSIRHFLHMDVSGVHFVLYTALFAHGCLGRTFCALYGIFYTWLSRAYILCSIRHFLHMDVSVVHFVLYMAFFTHGCLGCTFCALYGTFCTWLSRTYMRTFCALYGTFCTWMSWAYILCSIQYFMYITLSSVHFMLKTAVFVLHTRK